MISMSTRFTLGTKVNPVTDRRRHMPAVSRKKCVHFVLVVPLIFGLTGCETGNLVSFHGSNCKSDLDEKDINTETIGVSRQALSSKQYDGLNCIMWQTLSSNRMKIDLINFHGGCGVEWEGESSSDNPNAVELRVNDNDCISQLIVAGVFTTGHLKLIRYQQMRI